MSSYEFWLTDDAGRRLFLLKDISFFSYTRTTVGYPTIQLGLPYDVFTPRMAALFQPDWRIDAFRSPAENIPMRREGSFFLRKPHIYDRTTDSIRMIEFFGRGPLDILRRMSVVSSTVANYKKTDHIDDMMKAIVREAFLTPTVRVVPSADEFSVDGDLGLGPSITHSFQGKVVLDVLKDLKDISLTKNADDPANRKIYFDVVEGPGMAGGFGYTFRTYANLRGIDRTAALVFSVENGNLKGPDYSENYLDEITEAQVGTQVVQSSDMYLSRWNRIVQYQASSQDSSVDTARANQMLQDGKVQKSFAATFLNTPGGPNQPRSLYGVDWDLGDLLPVQYAGKNFSAEASIIYISVDEKGIENVIGSNIVGAPS